MSKILAVDDNERILYVVREMLETEGHEVIIANSARQCLEILKDEKPDLILMDVMMPEMDGWEAVKKIKEDASNKDIKISMLTVMAADRDRAKGLSIADWHIAKPVTQDKLLMTVDWLLAKA